MSEMQDKPGSGARKWPRHSKPPFVGIGGKVEERVDEAQDVWFLMEKEAKRLRREPLSGFIYLRGAVYEEQFWRARLRQFGKDGQNARVLREIPGTRQPQTAKERSEENAAHQQLLVWQTVAYAGGMYLLGEYVLDQTVAGFRQRLGGGFRKVAIVSQYDWPPGPPKLSTKLFDFLYRIQTEARAELLGSLAEQYHGDPGAKQANYLLCGLVRTRLKLAGHVGTRLRNGLAELAGDASYPAMRAQLLRELPGAVHSAWAELGPSKGVDGLRNLVSRLVAQGENDKMPYERQLAQFADREALLKRGRDAGLPPQEFELYKLLITKPGLKNKEYGAQLEISANHVGVLKSRIKKSLFA